MESTSLVRICALFTGVSVKPTMARFPGRKYLPLPLSFPSLSVLMSSPIQTFGTSKMA
jgi:hypothetical protein